MERFAVQESNAAERPVPPDARQPCGLRCRNGPLRRADNLVPAALWLADYWACLCVASGQKPSALLEKSHEKIMRRVATTASPSESRAANRDLGLCFVLCALRQCSSL